MRAAVVAVLVLVALGSSAGAGGVGSSPGPTFGRARAYATGYPSAAVAIGDLSGDAKPDLVSANGSRAHTVSVLINKGNGRFRAKREFRTAPGPQSVAIADLNADGSPDVATANDANLSVLLNNGQGGLRPKRDYATGRGPRSVAIPDVNGDSKPDLVTATTGGANGISVLLNTGDGTFQARRDFGPGVSPLDLAIGDLNGDGRADLATVNEGSFDGNPGLSVFLNAGDGTFPTIREYRTPFEPKSIEIGDVSGDDKPDLMVTYSDKESGPLVLVYLNRGRGGFGAGVRHSLHGDWATGGTSVAIGDLNGDRKADLAVTSRLRAVSVLVNLGGGRFQRQLDYGTGDPGELARALAIEDLNGDRSRDLVVLTYSKISVLLNRPSLCNVQEVRRQTLKAAKQTLARVNCRVGKVSFDYSMTIKGLVIRQKPKLGAVLPRGSKVDVVISRGGGS